MRPELYLDKRSPPVRSVLLLIEALGLEIERKPIDLQKGEHLSKNYLEVIVCKQDHTLGPKFSNSVRFYFTLDQCIAHSTNL